MKTRILFILLILFLCVENNHSQGFSSEDNLPSEVYRKSVGIGEDIGYPDMPNLALSDWRPDPGEGDESGLGVNILPVTDGIYIILILVFNYVIFIRYKQLKHKK